MTKTLDEDNRVHTAIVTDCHGKSVHTFRGQDASNERARRATEQLNAHGITSMLDTCASTPAPLGIRG